MFMLGLPGCAYLYQGEELGLPEAVDIPDEARQDPRCYRPGGRSYGRDGCRVPLPLEAGAPAFGFSPTGLSWIPQPALFARYARDVQDGVAGSMLEMYKSLLQLRRERAVGSGVFAWVEGVPAGVLGYRNGEVTVFINYGPDSFPLPDGEVLVRSGDGPSNQLLAGDAVWMVTG